MLLTRVNIPDMQAGTIAKQTLMTIPESSELTFKNGDKEFECRIDYLPKELGIEFINIIERMEAYITNKIET